VRLSLRQPHYHRQYEIAIRLVALRPALSQRYALIGESLFERIVAVSSTFAGANSKDIANVAAYMFSSDVPWHLL